MTHRRSSADGCFRSTDGGNVFAALKTYTASLRKKSLNIFDGLSAAWNGNPVLFNNTLE